jgi:hypothetical protein
MSQEKSSQNWTHWTGELNHAIIKLQLNILNGFAPCVTKTIRLQNNLNFK